MEDTRGQALELSSADVASLISWQRTREVTGPQARRARILELLQAGERQCDVSEKTGAGIATVGRVRRRCLQEGAEAAVFGYRPGGGKRLLSTAEEAHVVALACSDPPDGASRWTVRLLASEVVQRGYVSRVSRETIRLTLKSHGLKPWREKNVVRTKARPRVSGTNGRRSGVVRTSS